MAHEMDADDEFLRAMEDCLGCGTCDECVEASIAYADEMADECLHISSSEQAGGFLICDECGEDVTLEVLRDERRAEQGGANGEGDAD
jgi:hypothetical protein